MVPSGKESSLPLALIEYDGGPSRTLAEGP